MEESKEVSIIITIGKKSLLTAEDIKTHLGNKNLVVESITSPKGFRVTLSSDEAARLLEIGTDTLNTDKITYGEDDPFCTLYIKGVNKKLDEKDLRTALAGEGHISMCIVAKDDQYNPLGTAFVRFTRKADALKAAEKHKTLIVNDVELECTKYEAQTKPTSVPTAAATFKNVPSTYTEEKLRQLLSVYGQIADLTLNTTEGTGTVYYNSHAAVSKAIQSLNGTKLDDHTFIISDNSDKKRKATNYNNLYVGGLDSKVTDEELRAEFSKFGEIESLLRPTRKITDENGNTQLIPKSHCFVAFKDAKVASDVIKEMDGRTYWGKILDINYYDPQARHGPNAKGKVDTTPNNQMMEMMQQMMSIMVTTASNMSRGRGGYSGANQGYRGNNQGYRGGRGTRGNQRGGRGARGSTRGGPPGGHYQVRSQYEAKPMMPTHMGVPPIGGMAPPMAPPPTYGGHMDHGMGYNPGMHSGPSHPMAAPMHVSQPVHTEPAPAHEEDEGLGYSLDELKKMDKDDKDNIIGTFLYNKLEPLRGGEEAGKIAGMFLDLPLDEVIDIATKEDVFEKYLSEALDLIANEEGQE